MDYYYQIEGDRRDNIGDVLQGMVARRFLPADAKVADREALGDMNQKEKGLLIANGWYMHSFAKFPPPDNITPVYVSVHIAEKKLLDVPKVREHFRKHAPIGCRDAKTLRLFLRWGIPAYYSGCLTTTCQRRAPINQTGEGEVLLVDNMHHPVPAEVVQKLESLLGRQLTRISHDPPDITGTLEEYNEVSQQHMNYLLERYCKAALVVTTKIHCALPCLGMGANVMLVHPQPDHPRLNPVKEFMEIISYDQVLAADTLQKPQINKENLKKRQAFLEELVRKSVQRQKNIVGQPDNFSLRMLKLKSNLRAEMVSAKRKLKAGLKG